LNDDGNGTEETNQGPAKLGKQKIMKEAMALKDERIGDREKRAAGNTDKTAVS